jgi:hypothetical protein
MLFNNERNTFLLIGMCLQAILPDVSVKAQEANPFQQLREKNLPAALTTLGKIHDAGHYWIRDENDALPALVGGVARLLDQEDDEEQYDLLYQWTMPADDRTSVRVLTSPVPHAAPPKVFARVLRERPRDTSFEVPAVNGVRGVFSTGWKLVTLADELGRLDRLTTELEKLNEQGVTNADVLLLLAKMIHRQVDVEFIKANLPEVIQRVAQSSPAGSTPDKVLHPSVLVLGAAALRHDGLAPAGEAILRELRDKANWLRAYRIRAFLHGAHAVAVQRVHGAEDANFLFENQFQYWVPASVDVSRTSAEGGAYPIWLAHEEHLLHLTGVYNDVLLFRYPLQGDFEFTAEVQSTAPVVSNTGFGFGGLYFQSLGVTRDTTVFDADVVTIARKPCPFAREQTDNTFNRVAIRSNAQGVQYAINRHPVWTDGDEVAASPFLGFRYYGNHRSLIRNMELTGHPVIPREVVLSSGTQLRGWQSRFFGESKRSAQPDVDPEATFGWFQQDGEIHAAKRENMTERQSLLR